MHLKKIMLGLLLSTSFIYAWADEATTQPTTSTQSDDTTSARPAVTLPQDQDEIDAAPDDHEFAPIVENTHSKNQP